MSRSFTMPTSNASGLARQRRMSRIEALTEQLRSENARRVQCPHCPLMILDMATHLRICHSGDDE